MPEQLGQGRLTIIGHAAGTRLAISYAAHHPERVTRLLLVTPPSTCPVDEPADAAELIGERSGDPVFDKAVAAFQDGADLSDETAFNAWQQACGPDGVRRLDGSRTEARTTGMSDPAAAQAFFSVQPRKTWPEGSLPCRHRHWCSVARRCLTGVRPAKAPARLFPNADVVLIDQWATVPGSNGPPSSGGPPTPF
ncbi:alpha/beta fold hydrolase [Streptomyces sp. Ru87]|uniref:alpha/beta fold hydrolase n=1 Tax=Streptomyces sp. Ru87 TaxID=2044307 RepID=UPI000D1DE81F|nr:alpha/beta fold hydrolase [Streptomyces sp. Ru87]